MLTRGREANNVYVATDRDVEPLTGFTDEPPTGRGVLLAALANPGSTVSAHEVADDEGENAASIRTLAAEYETLAHLAQAPRWAAALRAAGLGVGQVAEIEDSPAYGALCAALRRADAHRLPVEAALPRLGSSIDQSARDPAAVLHARVEAWIATSIRVGRARPLRTVAELIPAVRGEVPQDFADALDDRARLMYQRIDQLLERAETAGAPWLAALGPRPIEASRVAAWEFARRSVAAYRDLYGISDPTPLGAEVPGDLQSAATRAHCAAAISAARPPQSMGHAAGAPRALSTDSAAMPSLRQPSAAR